MSYRQRPSQEIPLRPSKRIAVKEDQMRSDPYQERARALAIEAGLDPDAKIDRPGQRPMPTWCTFRDAARTEQVAVETAAVADALPPQAAQFQNSPLKIF